MHTRSNFESLNGPKSLDYRKKNGRDFQKKNQIASQAFLRQENNSIYNDNDSLAVLVKTEKSTKSLKKPKQFQNKISIDASDMENKIEMNS